MKNFLNRLKWIRKRFSWNYKYAIGKWDYMGDESDRYNMIVRIIRDCKVNKPKILDLGCGYGALNKYLSKDDYSYYLGIDLSDNAIDKARKQNFFETEFKVADIQKFIPKIKFDIIIFNEVLFYLDDEMKEVNRYANYSLEKGFFIFSFYGVRNDLIEEIGKKYKMLQNEVVYKKENNAPWGICSYEIKNIN